MTKIKGILLESVMAFFSFVIFRYVLVNSLLRVSLSITECVVKALCFALSVYAMKTFSYIIVEHKLLWNLLFANVYNAPVLGEYAFRNQRRCNLTSLWCMYKVAGLRKSRITYIKYHLTNSGSLIARKYNWSNGIETSHRTFTPFSCKNLSAQRLEYL